ncbi:GNAT family N-acetyltransferase [Haloferula sargassicola]|uniref:N-acetyltransferase domain-containing protein n=1 Tax=Haloferula sargassicola TaxID=490096 RepID=A0ABP9UMC8_9BACT
MLSPFSLDDAALVQRYAGDPQVARTTLHVPHPYLDGMAEKWIASHLLQYLEKRNVVFAIRSRAGDLYGAINLSLRMGDQWGELGYWIGLPFWNKGYCTDAARRVVRFGFEEMGLNKIYARYLEGNGGSGRVMEKIGMIREGIQRQHAMKDGVLRDVVEYGILRSEYTCGCSIRSGNHFRGAP